MFASHQHSFAAETLGLTAVELTAVGLKAARVVLAEALLKSRHTVCKSAHRALPGLTEKTGLRSSIKNQKQSVHAETPRRRT